MSDDCSHEIDSIVSRYGLRACWEAFLARAGKGLPPLIRHLLTAKGYREPALRCVAQVLRDEAAKCKTTQDKAWLTDIADRLDGVIVRLT